MLYMPGIFGEDLMDRWFDDMDREFARMEKPLYGHNAKNLMKTDVRERDDGYEVDIELPGFHKDEVQLSLENGYLNIVAAKGLDKDEKDKKTGKLIRQERYAGNLSRSFYIGEDITDEDVEYIIKNVKEVVEYLRSFSPVWRNLVAGKAEFIL